MTNTQQQLAAARAAGEPRRLAEALVAHAKTVVDAGRLAEARALLDEAAGIHEAGGRVVDQARCLVFAATLCRAAGELEMAAARAARAEAIAPEATPPRVSAATELGEIASLGGEHARAAACFGRALAHGEPAGLTAFSLAALHRKRAHAVAAGGRPGDAVADLERARELYAAGAGGERDAEHEAAARRTGVELATALRSVARGDGEGGPGGADGGEGGPGGADGGDGDGAAGDRVDALTAELRAQAAAAGDEPVLADLELLDASRAIDAGRVDEAIAACERARRHALAATAPMAYATAVMSIAELRESQGDRVAAYEALAVGWATVGDLLGEEAAKAAFAPRLEAQRARWGDEAFIAARDAYYERRRATR